MALKKENPNYSNYDIREIVMKDCIEIWQKATIKDALPEEYKDKKKAEAVKAAHRNRYGSDRPQNLLLLTKSAIFCPQFHTNGIFGHGI